MGIEPTTSAWKAEVLPLNYTRADDFDPPTPSSAFDLSPVTGWWRGKDSNLRRRSRQIYSLLPLTAREPLRKTEPRILISPRRGVNARLAHYLLAGCLREAAAVPGCPRGAWILGLPVGPEAGVPAVPGPDAAGSPGRRSSRSPALWSRRNAPPAPGASQAQYLRYGSCPDACRAAARTGP